MKESQFSEKMNKTINEKENELFFFKNENDQIKLKINSCTYEIEDWMNKYRKLEKDYFDLKGFLINYIIDISDFLKKKNRK